MASSSGFNFNTPTPSRYSGPFGSPGPGSSQFASQQFPPGQFTTSAINPQLDITPSRQSLTTQQSSSLPPLPPAQPPRQARTDSSFSYNGQPDFQDMSKSEVNPGFIDALGQSMGFNEADEEYRKGLHAFPKLARGLPRLQMQSNIIQVALLYAILKECCGLAEANRTSRALMSEIQIRLKDTFAISGEQKSNIRLIAGEMMLEPNHVLYMKLHLDVEDRICEKQTELRFINVFGNLHRQRVLSTMIRRTCSSIRNSYRELLCDSVIGSNKIPLDDFACNLVTRFLVSGRMALGRAGLAHIAILRRFAHEHSQFLDRQWAEDEEYDPDNTGGTNTPSEHVDLDNTSQSSGTMSTTTRSRKRRHTSPHSRQASTPQLQTPPLPVPFQKGSGFWTMVNKWFLTRMQADQLGTPWSSLGWIKYIEETIELDRKNFKPVPHVNPFLNDFIDDGAYMDDSGVSGGVAQVGLAGLIDIL